MNPGRAMTPKTRNSNASAVNQMALRECVFAARGYILRLRSIMARRALISSSQSELQVMPAPVSLAHWAQSPLQQCLHEPTASAAGWLKHLISARPPRVLGAGRTLQQPAAARTRCLASSFPENEQALANRP